MESLTHTGLVEFNEEVGCTQVLKVVNLVLDNSDLLQCVTRVLSSLHQLLCLTNGVPLSLGPLHHFRLVVHFCLNQEPVMLLAQVTSLVSVFSFASAAISPVEREEQSFLFKHGLA